MNGESFDIVAVGTGFATSFFLHRFLANRSDPLRILVLDAGQRFTHAEQLALRKSEARPNSRTNNEKQFVNLTPDKAWFFTTAFGGGSNCWYACTPRLMPEDFELNTRYGIGADWPLRYDDLEHYYCDAEALMNVAGDATDSPYPLSRAYPQRPHRFTEPDKILKRKFPGSVFSHPSARSPDPVPGQRAACCNNGVCGVCPVDAKFSINNGLAPVYRDPRVHLVNGARVQRLETADGRVTGLHYVKDGVEQLARCDLAVLGANALFNPHILLRSGFTDAELGRGLSEQVSVTVSIELDGVNNFQGSTISTALGYMLYGGENRRRHASALLQTINVPRLRNTRGKWLQALEMNFVFEDFRLPENHVGIWDHDPQRATTTFIRPSEHTQRGIAALSESVLPILAALPVKSYTIGAPWKTDSHIMGTTVMGSDPRTSVVDRDCIHHRYRNLLVLGSGVFPTAAPPNPTLTLSALALRSADRLSSRT
jgi:choline dehydrogenase-like flavoprotein